ncbi:uncharacterized protein LOC117585439 isoform X1 [Drosophila guanche]|uniref:DUF4794 domain-containing protein n=1 Tax=Drosophila guanche TaxID=7266 RepID=A0A3B0JK20_DROGU|nr:uncharacterized protein LOC117585439 isoform X1 [Drosophila guanche]XP_034662754.1 uncharacterized protein LOC117897813 isoform X1 [Drosophila subobscura]SPP82694.1 Hypothetical predicted protein [Drosophila guanche]
MKFLVTIATLCLCLAYVAGQQYFLGQFPSSRARFGFDPLSLAPASSATQQVRDPRQNRGPVVFPPSPPDAVDESSGVVVGASGYGFVPPQQIVAAAAAAAAAADPTFFGTSFQTPDTAYATYNYFSNPYTTRFRYF